jgi:aubergine-like protein
MLVSRSKKNDCLNGDDSLIYLVPELCRMTGLTDSMRTNFPLMQDLAKYTRLGPSQRVERLQKFNSRLKTDSEVSWCNLSCTGNIPFYVPEGHMCHRSVMS